MTPPTLIVIDVQHVRHRSADPEGMFVPGTGAFEFKAEAEPHDGELIDAEQMHRTALASLRDEFAEVMPTADALRRI